MSKFLMSDTDEDAFKKAYIANFISAIDAANCLANGCLPIPTFRKTVDNAEYMAGNAWKTWEEVFGVQRTSDGE